MALIIKPAKQDHIHQCVRCQHVWQCLQVKCQIVKAAKVNGADIICQLCFHILMAQRYAAHRGVSLEGLLHV